MVFEAPCKSRQRLAGGQKRLHLLMKRDGARLQAFAGHEDPMGTRRAHLNEVGLVERNGQRELPHHEGPLLARRSIENGGDAAKTGGRSRTAAERRNVKLTDRSANRTHGEDPHNWLRVFTVLQCFVIA
jgi:hypothetical protein